VDEAFQAVLAKLFLPAPGAAPKIDEYAGRAPLRSWLAAVASRTMIDLRRRAAAKPETPTDGCAEGLPARADPELDYLKARYRAEFEGALQAAALALDDRPRALLRLHFCAGMSIDALGAVYGVGRSTAARWLASARGEFLKRTKQILFERLGVDSSEYRSIAALVRSQIELSAGTLFGHEEG
jgi:RNA polymerase sigma-70 factor (ECF subfamily)